MTPGTDSSRVDHVLLVHFLEFSSSSMYGYKANAQIIVVYMVAMQDS